MQYMGCAFKLTNFSCSDCEDVCNVSYQCILSSSSIKLEALIINHRLGLGHQMMACAVCHAMFAQR